MPTKSGSKKGKANAAASAPEGVKPEQNELWPSPATASDHGDGEPIVFSAAPLADAVPAESAAAPRPARRTRRAAVHAAMAAADEPSEPAPAPEPVLTASTFLGDAPLRGDAPEPEAPPAVERSAAADETPLGSRTLLAPSYLDLAIFCRQFATLIEVGIPVLRALRMLARRTVNSRLREAITDTARGVEEGQLIHQAMARHGRVFTPLVVSIVRIGELGGLMEASLTRLAEIMESKARIKRKIIAASMYPLVALCVGAIVLSVIMLKAIPTFAQVYVMNDAADQLPGITRFVIGLSSFFAHTWWLLLIAVVAGGFGLKAWLRSPAGRRAWSWFSLKMPLLGGVSRKVGTARTMRTLGGLTAAGIPLTESLATAAATNENTLIAEALTDVLERVQHGERMADPLLEAGIFPPLVVDMLAIGEETGTLERMLNKTADIYDLEVETTLTGLTSIIEPLLIVLLGGMVLVIAVAVLLPYFNLSRIIQG